MTTAFKSTSKVVVVGRSRAQKLLKSTNTQNEIGAAISIIDHPGSGERNRWRRPLGLERVNKVLKLTFEDDLAPCPTAPTKEDIYKLIKWLRNNLGYFAAEPPAELGRLLIHCYVGQCRSAAAALIGFRMAGRDDPEACMRASCEHDKPQPNTLMLKLAKEILEERIGE